MKGIGIGVIGWGMMGQAHTYALRSMPLLYPEATFTPRLACVCARQLEHAKRAAELAGFDSFTDDYTVLLRRNDVDVVSICTPNGWHEEMAIAALKAGKHVYIDKPLSVTAESAHRIAEAAEQANMRTQIAFNNRFFPSTLRAKAIVDQGKLGEIVSFQARYLHSSALDPEKSVGWKYEEGGGVILDLASHAADLITWMIGFPEKVSCVVNRLYDERPRKEGSSTGKPLAEDHAILTCRMKNGALGTIEASKIATGSQDELSFEIYGRLGALRWRLTEPNALWFFDATVPEAPFGGMRGWMRIDCTGRYAEPHGAFPPQGASIGWTRSHIHSYYAFLRCVADCEPASPSISEGVPLMELLDAAQISAQNGVWMAL